MAEFARWVNTQESLDERKYGYSIDHWVLVFRVRILILATNYSPSWLSEYNCWQSWIGGPQVDLGPLDKSYNLIALHFLRYPKIWLLRKTRFDSVGSTGAREVTPGVSGDLCRSSNNEQRRQPSQLRQWSANLRKSDQNRYLILRCLLWLIHMPWILVSWWKNNFKGG